MKKGLFICCISAKDVEKAMSFGVMKKITAQVKTLSTRFDVHLDILNTYSGDKPSVMSRIVSRLPFTPVVKKWEYKEEYGNVDFLYIRRPPYIDSTLVSMLKKVRRNNPQVKILLEIPTYPYIQELLQQRFWKESIYVLKDVCNAHRLRGFVDRIVTFSPDKSIWNIETITVKNGVDFSAITIPERMMTDDAVRLVEVSSVNFWHGYDRLIKGIGEYYKNGGQRNVIFNVVGDGMTIPQYKELVEEYHIEDHVVFHGNKGGAELDEIYKQSFMGVDALGRHRSHNSTNSSLKSREYAAFGLPFITAVPIDFADDKWPYVLQVPKDESAIDMNQVIEFYDAIYNNLDCNAISKDIRTYAESRCDMSVVMQPILEFIAKD